MKKKTDRGSSNVFVQRLGNWGANMCGCMEAKDLFNHLSERRQAEAETLVLAESFLKGSMEGVACFQF